MELLSVVTSAKELVILPTVCLLVDLLLALLGKLQINFQEGFFVRDRIWDVKALIIFYGDVNTAPGIVL